MLTTSLGLTKSGVKWEVSAETQSAIDNLNRDSSVADLLKRAELAHEEVQKFQNESSPDAIKINNAIGRLGDILKKIDGKNIKDRQAVFSLLSSAVSSAPDNSDSKKGLEALKTQLEGEYKKIDEKNTNNTSQAKTDIKKETSRAFEAIVQKNSREQQAKDFTEYVASKLPNNLKTLFLDAFKKESDTIGTNPKYELENVSIQNLLQSIQEGTVYVADGAEFNDRPVVKKFLEFYEKNKDVFTPILKPLVVAARAGQSTESVRKSGNLPKDDASNKNIVEYLAKVDNFETHGTTALDRQLSTATVILLDKVKGDDTKFLQVLSNAAKLGGDSEGVTKQRLSTDFSLKYAILAGIRESSRLPGGINALIDTKGVSGIGENERRMLEKIDANKTGLLDGLEKGFDIQLKSLIGKPVEKGGIPKDKESEAQDAIKAYIAEMKKEGSSGWNIVSKNLGAAITNRGAGAAAGATMDFPPNWLAEKVSFGFGFSTGKPGFGVGITFDKSITPDTKLLYGWAGSPFIGMTTQFERWSCTPILGVGGGLINVSRDMGNKDLEVKNMEKMKSAEGILSQIDTLAKDSTKKSASIVFASDVSRYPDKSDNPMEATKSRVTALDKAINTDIQNRLALAGFDTESNPVIRAQMIHNALVQTIQSRIDRLHLNDATGGWSLKSLGLTLGSFAGAPFILPSISFGRTSYTQSMKLEKGNKNESTLSKPTAPGLDDASTTFDSLKKVESLQSALTNKATRIALSHLWNNPSRVKQVNTFVQSLQTFQKGDDTIENGKNAFLALTKGLPQLKSLSDAVGKIKDPKELQSALFDIRGAMMMDERQANTISVEKNTLNVNESPDATKKRFDSMAKSEKMTSLLSQIGLTANDYENVIKGSGEKNSKITIGEPKPNLVGAVASLKTRTPEMDIMPAGTMRFAKNDSGEFIKDVSSFDSTKKSKMYDTILPIGSVSEVNLRTNIAKVLDKESKTPNPITSEELKNLIVNGKATIGGKEVNMKDQKFYLGAYGDCTNPSIAIEPGKISIRGIPGDVPVSADGYNVKMASSSDTLGLTGAVGWVGKKPSSENGKNQGPASDPNKGDPEIDPNKPTGDQ